jgi:hypothetical protein
VSGKVAINMSFGVTRVTSGLVDEERWVPLDEKALWAFILFEVVGSVRFHPREF